MALLKVCTKSNEIPRRRRGGFEFTPAPQVVEVDDPAVEALIRADDALVVLGGVEGTPDALDELAGEVAAHRATRQILAGVTLERDAAFARLVEHGIELGDLSTGIHAPVGHVDDEADFGEGAEGGEPAGDRVRSERRRGPGGTKRRT